MRTVRRLLAVAAAALTLAGSAGCGSGDQPGRAGKDFLAAWSAGDLAKAAGLTDAPGPAGDRLRETAANLGVTAARFEPRSAKDGPGGAKTVPFRATLTLRALGTWTYDSSLAVRKVGGHWKVHWTPAAIHPRLTDTTRLRRQRDLPGRAPIQARDGSPLVTPRPVVTIGVWPAKLTDRDAAYAALREVDIDTARLDRRVRAAKPDAFVEVVTLRKEEFAKHEAKLRAAAGLVFHEGTKPLAPTATFARAVLGAVASATKETLTNAGPTASTADLVGSSGLQYAYQQQLAGTPGGRVQLVDRTDAAKAPVTLQEFGGAPGKPLATTLDRKAQEAAEAALAPVTKPSALVALKAGTGEVLAAANGPAGDGYDRALVGRYPPGSTFKVVTTSALVAAGVTAQTTVPCPPAVTVSGKRFENVDSLGSLGSVPFRADFAHSCNTAFIGLRGKVGGTALPDAATAFGFGGDWKVGLPAYSGQVPAPASEVERAADMIGQGKVQASPLAMASVAATVDTGTFHQPVLVPAVQGRYQAPRPLPQATVTELRTLMRAVVTEGSGKALADLPGAAAKTGTAEFGTANPPHTHAWMIGYRGDVAFAVLIEDGGGGGRNAGPVAARFLKALAG